MKIIIGIVAALILAGAGVAAGMFYGKEGSAEEQPKMTSRFFPMERFIVSVGSDSYSRYLVLDLSLSTKDPQFYASLEDASPILRNVLVQHFANVTREQAKNMFSDVATVQSELLEQFNQSLKAQEFDSELDQVLVTNVFIQ